MKNVQKSSSFLLPLLNLPGGMPMLEQNGWESCYSGDANRDYEFGKVVILEFTPDQLSSEYERMLLDHTQLAERYEENGNVYFVYKLTDEQYLGVGWPFSRGKYSEMAPEFTDKYIVKYYWDGDKKIPGMNYMIISKDEALRRYWESRGIDLPEGAEVWSAPKPEEEILNFQAEEVST